MEEHDIVCKHNEAKCISFLLILSKSAIALLAFSLLASIALPLARDGDRGKRKKKNLVVS